MTTHLQINHSVSNMFPKLKFVLVLLFSGLILSFPTATTAAIFTVDNTSDNGALTACTAAANDCSLRGAITAANNSADNDTINFDAGVFGSPQTITLGGSELSIVNNGTLTISGPGANLLSVSGNRASRVLTIDNGVNVAISGLTITGGETNGAGGGGIFNLGGTLTLTNGNIIGNIGRFGGGILNLGGTVNLTNSTISGNYGFSDNGGGIYNDSGTVNLTNSTISNNRSDNDGGGIFNIFSGTVNLTNSTISNNRVVNNGGGIFNTSGTINLTNSTISENLAPSHGGGIFNNGGIVNLTNNTIWNNSSFNNGGGIFNNSGSVNLFNSTVSVNFSEFENGGGIFNLGTINLTNSTISGNGVVNFQQNGGGIYNSGTVNSRNSIIAGNTAGNNPDFDGTLNSQGHNLIGNASGTTITGNTTSNIINVNAMLAPLGNYGGPTLTHALIPGSPAIDVGNNALAVDLNNQPLTTDQRGAGFPRINNGTVDMGAYEATFTRANTTTTITADTPDPTVSGDLFTVSYTVAVVPPGTGTPTGTVTVTDGVNSCTGTLTAGQCTLTLITAGNRNLIATYSGDANFDDSFSPGETHTVIANPDLTLTVDNTSSDGNLSACTNAPNDCSLRGAVNRANISSGNDIINFDPVIFSSPQTITLTSGTFNGQLEIKAVGSLTINGPGADRLSVSSGDFNRVFFIEANSLAVINGMTIRDGRFNLGGGIYTEQGSITLNNVTVRNNASTGRGGGIHIIFGNLIVNNSTIRDNTAVEDGGGIYNQNSTMAINNSTISGNSANRNGGGLYDFVGNTTLYYSTVSNNTSSSVNPTGALFSSFGLTNTYNTIMANNTGGDCFNEGSTVSAVHSIFGNSAACVNGVNSANLNGDPNLGPLQNNGGTTETHALLPGSIAIDAADPTDFPSADQRGFNRPVNGNAFSSAKSSTNLLVGLPDIGAFEVLAPTAAEASISGRVLSQRGRGIANAVVHITDQSGNIRTARTNHFGYFRFREIEVGQTLIVNVYSKKYQFETRVINFDNSITDLIFEPLE